MEFWKTKKFKDLSKQWEKKLEDSGFKDIEKEIDGEKVLKQHATNCYRQADETERDIKLSYYIKIGSSIEKDERFKQFNFFENPEQITMSLYSEGYQINEIVKVLKENGISRDRRTIRFIIRRWEMNWGIREWSLQQMNLKKAIK